MTQNSTPIVGDNPIAASEAAEVYRAKGYTRPIPINSDAKEPPEKDTTGGVDAVSARRVAEEALTGHRKNVGLVMDSGAEDFGLVAVDIDDYDEKNGYANLMQLCADLGVEWEESLRTTRRGAADRSGKRLYKVPAGVKFASAVCKGVDVVQLTHRYIVVAPSVVGGKPEQWYDADGNPVDLEDLPCAVDLPWLAPALVAHLNDGEISDPMTPAVALGAMQAGAWLESVCHNPHGAPTGALIRADLSEEALRHTLRSGAEGRHDTTIGLQRRVARAAVEHGAQGVLPVLERLRVAFVDAMTDPKVDGRTIGTRTAEVEFDRGLRTEVNKIRGEVEHGALRPLAQVLSGGAVSPTAFSNLGADDGTDDTARSSQVDYSALDRVEQLMWDHGGDDLPAQLLLTFCADLMAWRLDLHNGSPLSLFDVAKSRETPPGATFRPYLRRHVLPVVKAFRAQLPDPDSLADETQQAAVKVLLKKCADVLAICESENRAKPVLSAVAGLLDERGDVLKESDANTAENLLGLSDGEVIDLDRWRDGEGLPASVRPRRRDEIVTKSLALSGVQIRACAARLAVGEIAPVAELVRLVFGPADVRTTVLELMAYSLHGSNPHRLVWGVQGDTGTGKSTVMGFLTRALGDYAAATTIAALSDRSGGNNSAKARALRARIAFTEEFSQESKGNRDALKEIASNVPVSVTDKFIAAEERRGTVVAFTTNEAARVDFDAALEDRFVVVPTACTQEQVNALLSTFDDDWSTDPLSKVWLLSMMADHYARPWTQGFRKAELPAEIQECTSLFVAESNPAHRFISEHVEFTGGKDDVVAQSRLLEAVKDDSGAEVTARELQALMARFGTEKARVRDPRLPTNNPVAGFRGVRFAEVDNPRAERYRDDMNASSAKLKAVPADVA